MSVFSSCRHGKGWEGSCFVWKVLKKINESFILSWTGNSTIRRITIKMSALLKALFADQTTYLQYGYAMACHVHTDNKGTKQVNLQMPHLYCCCHPPPLFIASSRREGPDHFQLRCHMKRAYNQRNTRTDRCTDLPFLPVGWIHQTYKLDTLAANVKQGCREPAQALG